MNEYTYSEISKLRDQLQAANEGAENAERDAKANARIAGELIAAMRINVMRGTITGCTVEQIDEFLKSYAERIKL